MEEHLVRHGEQFITDTRLLTTTTVIMTMRKATRMVTGQAITAATDAAGIAGRIIAARQSAITTISV